MKKQKLYILIFIFCIIAALISYILNISFTFVKICSYDLDTQNIGINYRINHESNPLEYDLCSFISLYDRLKNLGIKKCVYNELNMQYLERRNKSQSFL